MLTRRRQLQNSNKAAFLVKIFKSVVTCSMSKSTCRKYDIFCIHMLYALNQKKHICNDNEVKIAPRRVQNSSKPAILVEISKRVVTYDMS